MFNGSRDPPYPVCVPRVFMLECVLTNWCLHSQRAPTLRLAFFFSFISFPDLCDKYSCFP